MSILKVKNLNFEYANAHILHDINFEIESGGIIALVGPNGAGKTTLLRSIIGLETILSGQIILDGIDVFEDPRKAHSITGYLSDFFGLYDNLTVKQSLTHMAWSHKVPDNLVNDKVNEIAEIVGVTKYLDQKSEVLSRGYRQRLGIGLAIIGNPKFLVLDEPASGMDPESRHALSKLILNLHAQGMTIIVSSHILAELEDYCTDMIVIRDGKIVKQVSLNDNQTEQKTNVKINFEKIRKKDLNLLNKMDGLEITQESDNELIISLDSNIKEQEILSNLITNGAKISGFQVIAKTLQEEYMKLAQDKGEE